MIGLLSQIPFSAQAGQFSTSILSPDKAAFLHGILKDSYLILNSGLENSMDYIVHGVAKSQTGLSDFHFHFTDYF